MTLLEAILFTPVFLTIVLGGLAGFGILLDRLHKVLG